MFMGTAYMKKKDFFLQSAKIALILSDGTTKNTVELTKLSDYYLLNLIVS